MACFLLIVPLNAFTNCQRSYWCINGVKLAIFTVRYQWHRWCMTSPVSMTLVTCFAGVIDTGKYMLRRCHWHRRMHALPVPMTPVRNFLPVSLTPVKLSKTVKEIIHQCQWHRQCMHCRCRWHRRSTEIIEYLCEYSKKMETVSRLVYWGQKKLFEEKNQR